MASDSLVSDLLTTSNLYAFVAVLIALHVAVFVFWLLQVIRGDTAPRMDFSKKKRQD
eukprot:m.358863 g.358863  ORF g.358863 m.358863 type:complete len:57 (+) comp18321_c0_seq1:155-325(+)